MADVVTIALSPGTPSYRQRTVLDGVEYVLDLRWSEREYRWYLDLRDAHGRPLALAIKIVANWPLLHRSRAIAGIPPGEIIAVDQRKPPRDPGFEELGAVVPLVYISRAAVDVGGPS